MTDICCRSSSRPSATNFDDRLFKDAVLEVFTDTGVHMYLPETQAS